MDWGTGCFWSMMLALRIGIVVVANGECTVLLWDIGERWRPRSSRASQAVDGVGSSRLITMFLAQLVLPLNLLLAAF